ncbi:hypothetical protein SCALIN_C28_0389 [Candidatus Scalindua japonica]|uniref:Uncharacterized protein n=1 Tax=Candidatus Scalindua japonica TaxID=1284222 RepID=A0A286U240_9BACT|nr:hypothetical protein [Candidatus Scalindua japonica]GAX62185.1 hypothetical protein SCALIN_C28_0389 [Candidatus Scalindua japonica]
MAIVDLPCFIVLLMETWAKIDPDVIDLSAFITVACCWCNAGIGLSAILIKQIMLVTGCKIGYTSRLN